MTHRGEGVLAGREHTIHTIDTVGEFAITKEGKNVYHHN
jgi:hypothetical protein